MNEYNDEQEVEYKFTFQYVSINIVALDHEKGAINNLHSNMSLLISYSLPL